MRSVCNILVGKVGGKRPHERQRFVVGRIILEWTFEI
jgi:hypothetical protein